ncbi:MAG: hypothetical protein GY822_03890 [Deltaproteobacteria bacterium]|nr:hypothetical protein [Deltaproteobacteria bacterium]
MPAPKRLFLNMQIFSSFLLVLSVFSGCDVVKDAAETAKAATSTVSELDRKLRMPLTKDRLLNFVTVTPKLMNDAKAEGIRIPMPSTHKSGALFDATDFDHLGKVVPFFKRHQGDFSEWLAVLLKSQDALSQISGEKSIVLNGKSDWALKKGEVQLVRSMEKKVKSALKNLPR